ncbi:hypothetical protein VOLCADRAFT_103278 [Volvox carteri f. nagariensis]|uniref:Uncharacterized protein n=1 Tax=Volvox carteri f. nagariensis TaxID=3068 RepID=D8TKY3_VOLCA|nr:uncharacterized protein VOLCADRAFT_103278 [Volvox carteri f. nagariensis]EFJ51643.1 hypothetical protein VOLCADRAFT_103278 [Volvox carteri f. nagariensis]|eukprot:XP_002947053.1 hypothetical protein VOLCADRAFT_103278 [Volvox carteri f. nagariensis]
MASVSSSDSDDAPNQINSGSKIEPEILSSEWLGVDDVHDGNHDDGSDPDYTVDDSGDGDDDEDDDVDDCEDEGEEGGQVRDLVPGHDGDELEDEDEDEDQPADDYLDDGTEENDSAVSDPDIRRPISVQEFLAWRLLGRVPREPGFTKSTDTYIPPPDCCQNLRQQLQLDTGAVEPQARNRGYRFDSPLDAGFDSCMFASREAQYGKKIRQAVREAVASDPRVTARVTLLGTSSHKATDTLPASPAAAAAAASASPQSEPTPINTTAPTTTPTTASCSSASTRTFFAAWGCRASPAGPAGPAAPGVAAAAAAAPPSAASASPADLPPVCYLSGLAVVPSPRMIRIREVGQAGGPGAGSGWSASQRRHMACHRALPRYPRAVVDSLDSRAYIGQFSADGRYFVAAFQDRRVRLYDVERGWRLRKDITTRMCRWTITDTSISPDQRFVLYSSIIPIVHLVEVGSVYDSVSSVCNITQIHEPLNFESSNAGGFGIWSVKWSGDGREIVVGNNDSSVVVMDVETKRVVAAASGHTDDVNAVTYADASPNIIISGSDDTFIKVWDRRTMPGPEDPRNSRPGPRPVGVFVGHTEGLTHLHSRGDGLHVLSNAKDQTAKLWDLRMVREGGSLRHPAASEDHLATTHVPRYNWDYRWQEYPGTSRVVKHPLDSSVQTFRGHTVQSTLIRAYFSPAHTTGQRFVYTGCATGGVHVYDIVTGQEVEGSPLRLHRKLVRDVSWHPFDPVLATVSWDGTVVRWDAVPPDTDSRPLLVPGRDAFNDNYY